MKPSIYFNWGDEKPGFSSVGTYDSTGAFIFLGHLSEQEIKSLGLINECPYA